MANFPLEIITDIICRLPVKDLLRYRCVKSWRSMIDGPDFIKLHIKQSMESHSNLSLVLIDFREQVYIKEKS